ncbi:ABC transporter ATP-binding protein [Brachybacterium sp. AOP25-B2-12]|uniref:ABC transporter ATP-binding protein n=1 Tax=Brachybacterium sp. AOP25-B2-12 TaxID=3457710 RepID=UPI0040349AF0
MTRHVRAQIRFRLMQLGVVFSRRARRGLVLLTLGSIAVTLMETGAILLVAPLLQVLTGADVTQGVLGTIAATTGLTSRQDLTLVLLAAVVAGFLLKDTFSLAFKWWSVGFLTHERAETYAELMQYYLDAPYPQVQRRSMSSMYTTIGTSTGQLYASVAQGLVSLIIELTTVIVIGTALLVATPLYSVGLLVVLGVTGMILLRAVRPRVVREGGLVLSLAEQGFQLVQHAFGGMKEIKLRHSQAHFVGTYRRLEHRAAHSQRVLAFVGDLPKAVLEIAFFVCFFVLTVVVVLTQGTSSLVVSIGLLGAGAFRLLPSLSRLIGAVAGIRSGLPALDAVHDDLAASRTIPPHQDPAETPMPFEDALRLEAVTFRYAGGDADVLRSIDLTIPAGSSMAFVGTSGAGKSTLVDVILGLQAPTRGTVTADGTDIASDPAAWHANIAVVPQEVFLMDATIRENIAFDQDAADIDDERIADALARAQLTEFVRSLPEGTATRVGERGTRLSGGQRQRLGIARALYGRPRLLVLDEATSALDNETERRITATISALRGEVTVLVIAHRLSTVRDVDTVAMMADGRIEALGTFSEVRAASPAFAHLVDLGRLDAGPPGDEGQSPHETPMTDAPGRS